MVLFHVPCRLRNLSTSPHSHFSFFLGLRHSNIFLLTFTTSRMASSLPQLPVFEAMSSYDPKSTTVIHSNSGRSFTYGGLLKNVAQEKEKLISLIRGEQRFGQRIAFMVENSYDYVVTLLSIFAANSIAVPLSPAFPVSELQFILGHSQATLLLASPKFVIKAQQVVESFKATKPRLIQIEKNLVDTTYEKIILEATLNGESGMILYTSGTTDRPKGVLHPQSVITAQSKSLVAAWEHTPKDHLLHVLPLHHIHGVINGIMAPLFAGSTIEFLFPFNPSAVWERIAAPFLPTPKTSKKITYFTAVPTIYSRLLNTHKQLSPQIQAASKKGISSSNLRLNISGSAALPVSCKRAWTELSEGNVLLERYGMTEVGMALSCGLAFEDRVDGSVGWALPNVEVRLVDTETNEIIHLGEELDKNGKERDGEIQLRGPTIFKEYFRNEKATLIDRVQSENDCQFWFKTGDIAIRRVVKTAGHSNQEWARGPMYFIRGRRSADIIKSGGEKVSALEVERELLLLPHIDEAVVLGVPSGAWGQKIAAVVILTSNAKSVSSNWTVMDMRRALRDRLANYQIPRILKVVDHIPRNAMGKINKKELVTAFFKDDMSGDEKI